MPERSSRRDILFALLFWSLGLLCAVLWTLTVGAWLPLG
jgi:hypothetical protein